MAPAIAQEPVTIIAFDPFYFDPDAITVMPGQQVIVDNDGVLQHDLNVDEWEVTTGLLDNGESATFTVPDDAQPGTTVPFYCSVPGHMEGGQEGIFRVVAEGAGDQAQTSSESGTSQEISLSAFDVAFAPPELEVYPSQHVTVINDGILSHDLVVDEWGLTTMPEDAEVGSTVTFYCSVPGHRGVGQEGTFTVIDPSQAMPGTPVSEIDRLEATISALEQEHSDLSATATAIVGQQQTIEERLVALEIQRAALIEATVAAEQTPAVPTEPAASGTSLPERESPPTTVTPAS